MPETTFTLNETPNGRVKITLVGIGDQLTSEGSLIRRAYDTYYTLTGKRARRWKDVVKMLELVTFDPNKCVARVKLLHHADEIK